jgi:hypothetical protein
VNSIHPDAVYDTALWTEELLKQRAAAYNMTVEQYRRKNLLGDRGDFQRRRRARRGDVRRRSSPRPTAAQIPVDGGNERVV